jgi:phage terminase large subunit
MATLTVETGYRPRPLQADIHRQMKRFNVLVCHRRFGKTILCINELVDRALRNPLKMPRYAYIAPLYKQAKAVAFDYLVDYTQVIPGVEVNKAELRVDFVNAHGQEARISLYGADNVDALRGIYLDGAVLDEYGQHNPRLWGEVIRPTLADRLGWAIFIGTPMGQNQFYDIYERARSAEDWFVALYKASETNVLPETELQALKAELSPDEFEQELECSFQAAIKGAYYGDLMARAREDGRITDVPYDPALPVETWWDLGHDDATTIWFVQRVKPNSFRVIDYYEASGEALSHYGSVVAERKTDRGYHYSEHYAPHDAEQMHLGMERTRKEQMLEWGVKWAIQPRVSDVMERINAVRAILPMCWFDEKRCAQGIKALEQYKKEWNPERQVFLTKPRHDWSSHAADAFGTGAMVKGPRDKARPLPKPRLAIA